VLRRDPSAHALCLVQEKFRKNADERLADLALAAPDVAARVDLVEGDITHPSLGLAEDALARTSEATEIWHLAAAYDLSVARDAGLAVNVDGTRHVLDLAARCAALTRLHYVSTCYVSGRYVGIFGEEDLEKGQSFNNYYEETKYLAEGVVREAMHEGLPVTVYRPSIVVGDSRTGETQKYDGPYYIIRWILRQPGTAIVPVVGDPLATRVNLVPRDFVIDSISHLSALPHSVGRTYQLADPNPLTVQELLDVLAEAAGKRLKRVRVPRETARWAIDRVPGVRRMMGIPSATIDYFAHPTHYTVSHARADLHGSGIEVPSFPTYARRLVNFMREHPKLGSEAMT
jgi:thioester reductase-like protein